MGRRFGPSGFVGEGGGFRVWGGGFGVEWLVITCHYIQTLCVWGGGGVGVEWLVITFRLLSFLGFLCPKNMHLAMFAWQGTWAVEKVLHDGEY